MKSLITTLFILLLLTPLHSQAAVAIYGGYDLKQITTGITKTLVEKGAISESDGHKLSTQVELETSIDPLIAGSTIIQFYTSLGSLLVNAKVINETDVTKVVESAKTGGGIKISGINPVVLSAAYLNLLSGKGLITVDAAQNMLDTAKGKKR